jgi:cytochrome c biogenesis protein CcmG, thiol:disulfide interchange protein DsbE
MKLHKLLCLLPAAALCAATLAAPAARAADAGGPAPEFTLPGLKDSVSLTALKGKVVYVDFWASWCGPCKQSFPFMSALQTKYRAQGLEVVAINLDAKRSDADAFLVEVPAGFTVAFDAKGESAKRFGVKGMPSSYVIGRDGRLLLSHQGFKDDDRKELEARIAQALSAKQ